MHYDILNSVTESYDLVFALDVVFPRNVLYITVITLPLPLETLKSEPIILSRPLRTLSFFCAAFPKEQST